MFLLRKKNFNAGLKKKQRQGNKAHWQKYTVFYNVFTLLLSSLYIQITLIVCVTFSVAPVRNYQST